MNKDIKIIIIGFGSIGQRHYKNLCSLGFNDVYVYDVDDLKLNKQEFKSVNDICAETLEQFDVALICNPNNLHMQTALECARAGCHLFIEKPLSNNLRYITELEQLCDGNKLINMVACNMRFHPCLQFIKEYLSQDNLGKLYSISHEFGYYLPYWRLTQDYRKNYAAKKQTGGGIILDDIHEFDLLFWLNDFVEVADSKFIFGKVSDLEIETEDACVASFKFKNNVLGSVRCDYLQQAYSRKCKIVAEKGNLEWDINENIVWLKTKEKNEELFKAKDYDLNDMYVNEMKYFFECINKNNKTFNSVKTAHSLLKYCLEYDK